MKGLSQSKVKILLIGDYSNCHANLAKGLEKLGCDVTLMAPYNYLSSRIPDINSERKGSKWGGAELFLKTKYLWHNDLRGYDIVAINDPNFLQLHPLRLKPLFKRLKRENGSLFYTAMSIDVNYLRMISQNPSLLRYSEFFIDGRPSPWNKENPQRLQNWLKNEIAAYQDFVFDNIDGAVAVLYEYYLGLKHRFPNDMIAYGGIPILTDEIELIEPTPEDKVRIFLGRDKKRIKMKGTDLLETAAKNLVVKYPEKIDFRLKENIPYNQFIEELKNSDIVLDQVYSYTPATTALLAMAMGKTVVSGGEPAYYDFINEKNERPIINAEIVLDKLTDSIERVALDKEFIIENAQKSREFVEKHNKETIVAKRFLDFWLKK